MKTDRKRCGNCLFFKPRTDKNPKSTCNRYPPQTVYNSSKNYVTTTFPITLPDEWCGEWVHENDYSK